LGFSEQKKMLSATFWVVKYRKFKNSDDFCMAMERNIAAEVKPTTEVKLKNIFDDRNFDC
jgi:hypothetical protein